MSPKRHLNLLVQAIVAWAIFFAIGWPDYFQQYSTVAMACASVLLQALIGAWATWVLGKVAPEKRLKTAVWYAIYFSVPLAVCDALYCGVHLGLGNGYFIRFWYLTVFYFSVWVALIPTALVMAKARERFLPSP